MARAAICAICACPSLSASGNPWYDDFVAYDNTYGDAYTARTDAAYLAWQESYLLRSYLNLYEVSQDTAWLSKFTDHFDTVMGTATDSDGDGYEDWTSARYSPNMVLNAGFETADAGDTTLPANWTRSGSTAATAFRTDAPGDYIGGNACSAATWGAELVTAGTTLQRLYQDLPGYLPNHRYELSFYAKNGGAVAARAFVYDRTAGTVLGSVFAATTYWKNYTVSFVMPAAGHDVEVWLSHAATTTSGDTMFFDNIRVSPFFSYHVLDGMIGIPVADFVRQVDQNATTLASFQTKADAYQAFLEDHVIAKWEDSAAFYGNTWVNLSGTKGYYAEPSGYDTFSSSTSLSPLPHNQYFALLEVQNILFEVNGSSAYRTKADQGATFFANLLATQGSYCTNHLFSRELYGWIPYAQFDPLVWYIGAVQYAATGASGHNEAVALSQLIKWDPVKLTNQGFELADSADPTLPARWERFLSTAATAYRDSANASRGACGLTFVANGTQWQKLKQAWTDYVPAVTYVVTFDAKVDGSGADGRVWVYNDTAGTTIASYNVYDTTWTTHSFSFTAPADPADAVSLLLGHRDYTVSGGQVHYDNVSIKRSGDAW